MKGPNYLFVFFISPLNFKISVTTLINIFKKKFINFIFCQNVLKFNFLLSKALSSLFDLAPSGVCHAFFVTKKPVSSYLAVSPLPWLGGLFSVALSLKSPSPAISWHCVFTEPGLSSIKYLTATVQLSGKSLLIYN